MLVKLGTQIKSVDDPVELLLECHGRIRDFTAQLGRLAQAASAPPAQIQDAAARIGRYFTVGLAHHVEDEEQAVRPLLRGRSAELDAALARMCDEHESHHPAVERAVALCRRLEWEPGALAGLSQELGAVSEKLSAEFEAHLREEEEVVFPALRALLGPDELSKLRQEIRGRRAR